MNFFTHQLGYIDPGSGSIMFQVILAGVLGVVWRIKNVFRIHQKPKETSRVQQEERAEALNPNRYD